MRTALASSLLLVSAFAPRLHAQERRQVLVPTLDRELRLAPACYLGDRLLVKFAEGLEVRLPLAGKQGTVAELTCRAVGGTVDAARLGSFARLRALLGGHRVEAVFSRPVAELDAERGRIAASLPASYDPPADLANWYRLSTGSRARSRALLAHLLGEGCVETAEPEFRPEALRPAVRQGGGFGSSGLTGSATTTLPTNAPPALDTTPLLEGMQFHLFNVPVGLGFIETLGLYGAQGNPAQTIVHVEAAWNLDHEDLPGLRTSAVLGKTDFGPLAIPTWIEHGTACVGILHAARDQKGVRGYVPRSTLRVASAINGFADMISLAARATKQGDVVTSSLVFSVEVAAKGYHAPLDFPQVTYDVLRNLVLAGVSVTCAAGNSGTDLATEAVYGKRYAKSSAPSGVFLCGATQGPESTRVAWSNYGDAVEANAWGFGVTTTGYGHIQRDARSWRSYTNIFGGTSAAAPQVAGVLASLQSMAVLQLGAPFTVDELRKALVRTGVKIDGIGRRPLMPALSRELGLWSGLRVLGEYRPGEVLQLEVELPRGTPYMTFLTATPGGLQLAGLAFLCQVAGGVPLLAGATEDSGTDLHRIRIPADLDLGGLRLVLQNVYLDRGKRLELSNAAELWLR
ncbi:MAG: S8 family serine peptidase [Planctomycetota bacterium]